MAPVKPYKTQEELCALIRSVWWVRGHKVDVKVVDLKVPHAGNGVTHYRVIASNLVNGLPAGGEVNVPKPPSNWQPPPPKEKAIAYS